jgi:hypothetical protein
MYTHTDANKYNNYILINMGSKEEKKREGVKRSLMKVTALMKFIAPIKRKGRTSTALLHILPINCSS